MSDPMLANRQRYGGNRRGYGEHPGGPIWRPARARRRGEASGVRYNVPAELLYADVVTRQESRLPAQQTRHQAHARAGPSGERQQPTASPFASGNYYQLLNVPYDASRRDITKAYRQAMMRAHPDRVLPERRAVAEDLSKLLNRAYSTLSDPQKRLIYDRSIRADVVQDQIMNRYVGGFAGPGMSGTSPMGDAPRRQMTERERRDWRRSDRSAMISLLSVFAVVAIGTIGLMVLFALASLAISLAF